MFGVADAAVGLLDEGHWQVVARLAGALDDSTLRARLSGELTTSDRGEFVAPLHWRDGTAGSISLRRAAPFEADDLSELGFLANQAGAILENNRLFEVSLRHQREQF